MIHLENVYKKYLPANIRLDEEVFRIHLQKTPSRRLEDLLIKTNMFLLVIHLQDVFKTFSRCLEDVLKTFLQDVFLRRF